MAQPAPEAAVAMRKSLMALQDGLVKDMKIDVDAVDLAKEELRSAQVSF
jgi:hypothetical protein